MKTPLEPEKHRALRRRLELLAAERRTLGEKIKTLTAEAGADQVLLRRLKNQKQQLDEEIERLKSALIPDLNA